MANTKTFPIRIPFVAFERLEKLTPGKKRGRNRVLEFRSNIFLQGLESPYFLTLENDSLKQEYERLKRVNESLAKSTEQLRRRLAEQQADGKPFVNPFAKWIRKQEEVRNESDSSATTPAVEPEGDPVH